jgi:conjugative relaxase-like TrwC/TraI family protein
MMSMAHKGGFSAGEIQNYFDQELTRDDYYTQGQRVVGQWVGKGAAALGLGDEVGRDEFNALLQGINPHDGTVLVKGRGGIRRAGFEAQFSCPKSVSIQALTADSRLIQAHERAVQLAISEIEKFALTRQNRGQEWVVSANLVGARFTHLAARPADNGIVDPQLHTHLVMINMTERPDGQWRALDPTEIFNCQNWGSAIYLSTLANEVQRLGYRIHQTDAKYASWELDGYSREQIESFSNRSDDIRRQMEENGWKGTIASHIAALATRNHKTDQSEADLKAEWQRRAIEYGLHTAATTKIAFARGPYSPAFVADKAVEFSRMDGTEREARLDRRQLEATALRHGMGQVTLAQVRLRIAEEEAAGILIQNRPPDYQHPEGSFTTDEMIRLETENIEMRREGIGKAAPIASAEEVREWAAKRGLFADQTDAAERALASPDQIVAIEGLAGTTKTTTCGAIKEYAERHGYAVFGFSMQSPTVNELKKAGIEARTIASLTNNPVPPSSKPQLWIVDESSLLATKSVNQLLKIARREGIARVIVVGDQRQHLAIEAGHPMKQFLEDGIPVAELTNIMRQRDPELRAVVIQASQGKPGAAARAIDLLDQQHRLTAIEDPRQRYAAIAQHYLRAHEANRTALVVSPGNDERRDINRAVRDALVESGHVEAKGHTHHILVPRQDLTAKAKKYARYYDVGDVVHFAKAHKKQGIARDAYLTVKAVNRDGNLLTLQYLNGRTIEVSPCRWEHLEVYTQEKREIAVGDRIEYRIYDHKRHIANHSLATVAKFDGKQALLKFDDGRTIKGPLSPHIDLGYCSTSMGSQGTTVDRVMVNLDSMRSPQLVNRRSCYVTLSRGREDAHIFTNDSEALRKAVGREQRKESALEITPQQQPRQSVGMRI